MSCYWLCKCSSRPALDPRSCPHLGLKLCSSCQWLSRPADQICPIDWEVPTSTAKFQRILISRMGFHLLTVEQGHYLRLPRYRHVCRLCCTGAEGNERLRLLKCRALADRRDRFSPLVTHCSGVMAWLEWARQQPMVSRYIIACICNMSCYDEQTLSHLFILIGCQG